MTNTVLKITIDELKDWVTQVRNNIYENVHKRGVARFKRRFIEYKLKGTTWIEFKAEVPNYGPATPPESVIMAGLADWIKKTIDRSGTKCEFQLVSDSVQINVTDTEAFFDLLLWFGRGLGNYGIETYDFAFHQIQWSNYCPLYQRLRLFSECLAALKCDWLGRLYPRFKNQKPDECYQFSPETYNGMECVSDYFDQFLKGLGVTTYESSIIELAIDECFQKISWIHYSDFMSHGKHEIIVKDGVVDKDWYEKTISQRREWAKEDNWNNFWGLHLSPIHYALYNMGLINAPEDDESANDDCYENISNYALYNMGLINAPEDDESANDDSYENISKYIIPGKSSFKINWEVDYEIKDGQTIIFIKDFKFEMI